MSYGTGFGRFSFTTILYLANITFGFRSRKLPRRDKRFRGRRFGCRGRSLIGQTRSVAVNGRPEAVVHDMGYAANLNVNRDQSVEATTLQRPDFWKHTVRTPDAISPGSNTNSGHPPQRSPVARRFPWARFDDGPTLSRISKANVAAGFRCHRSDIQMVFANSEFFRFRTLSKSWRSSGGQPFDLLRNAGGIAALSIVDWKGKLVDQSEGPPRDSENETGHGTDGLLKHFDIRAGQYRT